VTGSSVGGTQGATPVREIYALRRVCGSCNHETWVGSPRDVGRGVTCVMFRGSSPGRTRAPTASGACPRPPSGSLSTSVRSRQPPLSRL